jgi:hypothetical protein
MGGPYSLLRVNEHLFPATPENKACAPTRQALGGGIAHPGTSTDHKRDLPITFTLHDVLRSTHYFNLTQPRLNATGLADSWADLTRAADWGRLADPKYWETEQP